MNEIKKGADLSFIDFPLEVSQLDIINFTYFDQLLNNRTIVFNEEVGDSVVHSVYLPLKKFEEDNVDAPVTLILNTVGGSVYDGLFLCNVIDNYKKKLNIIVPGYCMSMGAILLTAGSHNPNVTKSCYPHSIALFHNGEIGVSGEAKSVEDVMEFNKKINKLVKDYIIEHTKITEELYKEHDRKQWYLTADEMLEYGLVDKIIGSDD